jgi:hypothetical protein
VIRFSREKAFDLKFEKKLKVIEGKKQVVV